MYIKIHVLYLEGGVKDFTFATLKNAYEKSVELKKSKRKLQFTTWLIDDISGMAIELDSLV